MFLYLLTAKLIRTSCHYYYDQHLMPTVHILLRLSTKFIDQALDLCLPARRYRLFLVTRCCMFIGKMLLSQVVQTLEEACVVLKTLAHIVDADVCLSEASEGYESEDETA